MDKAMDSRGCEFDSQPLTTPGKLFCSHTCASVTKQYNLVLAKGRRRSSAGKVTAGLAESNGNLYRWVYDYSHLRADCLETGSAPDPTEIAFTFTS